MYARNSTERDMGNDYNHSTFLDLILAGLFGIRAGRGVLRIAPLTPASLRHWCVDSLKLSQHWVTVLFDSDGSVYGPQYPAGLTVLIDGEVAAHRSDLGVLVVPLL